MAREVINLGQKSIANQFDFFVKRYKEEKLINSQQHKMGKAVFGL